MKTKSYIILTLILMIMPFLSTNGTNSLDKFIYNEIEETIIHADTYGMQKYITYLKKILEQTPDNDVNDKITINESIGFLYLHLGNSQASVKIFKSNLKILQATYPEEYGKHMISVLGIMLSSSNHITDYKQFMEYMVKYDNSPYYHLMFGLLSTEAKDFKSALEHFQTGLNLCENKNSIETKWIRMFSLIIKEQIVKLNIELGEYEKSLECIKKFRQEIDDDFEQDTYYGYILDMNMATIYRLLGNHDKARYYINSIEQSLQTKGESETYLNGKTLELKGDICFHEKDFESAYQLYYNSEQIYGHIGTEIIPTVIKELECMYKIRNDDESRKIEQRLEKWFDKNWNITYYINYLYVTGGFWSKSIMNSMAIDCLKGGMELIETIHGDYDEILKFQNSLGGAYFYSGDYMSAVNLYTDIIENERKRAKNLFAYLTESQRELYWKNRESLMNNIFMLNREGTITISRGTVFVDRKNNKNICKW